MTRRITVLEVGPLVTVQDLGRPGYFARGLSAGGAIDQNAHGIAAGLLGQSPALAALELLGSGITIRADGPVRIALTGTPMMAMAGDTSLRWSASHRLDAETTLTIRPTVGGVATLAIGGGAQTQDVLGSRSAHLSAGIGRPVRPGDTLAIGPEATTDSGWHLPPPDASASIGIIPGPQTALFGADALERFAALPLTRGARGNRQGMALDGAGDALRLAGARSAVSEAVLPGDIQITGDGQPYVLGPECQTTGGYPRIGSVIPQDLARIWQASPGASLTFVPVNRDHARANWRAPEDIAAWTQSTRQPLVRNPADIPDLLSHQLIDGVTRGDP